MTEDDANILDVSAPTRLTSIDVFRIIAVLILIYFSLVNERSFKVSNTPSWMKHAYTPNRMTIVDVGSPFFAFIIGMCIPIAINRRLEKTRSQLHIWVHILIRTVSMMLMGILMANLWMFNESGCPIGMSLNLWGVLLFVSFFLIWIRYPRSQGFKRGFFITLRCVGVALLIYLVAIFRREEDMSWLAFGLWGFHSWWVLGILAWAYLVSCIIYITFRRHIEGVMGCLGLLILLYIADGSGVLVKYFPFLDSIKSYVSVGILIGTWPSISTAGVVVGMLHMNAPPAQTARKQILSILIFGTGLFIAGFLLSALGISSGEGRATPTWALYSSAISCAIYAFLYWLLDVHGKKRWVNFILPVGTNALLAYLLSRMIYPLFGLLHLDFINNYFNSGIAGILRTALYTALLVLLSRFLTTRCRIVLHL